MSKQWLTESAASLAHAVRDGQVSSRELVEAHIERVEAVNPIINAMVADRFQLARQEAEACDNAIREGAADLSKPLFGVPCTIKECFAFPGMPNTSGLKARVGYQPTEAATGVQRIRAAGAIPLGVTNTSELCMWMETNNRVYGRTNNPYNPAHIVGGSSGGEGAIIAAGGSPFGLGSDVGGSIRMPAFFNGVFGHKPTGTLVPGTGQFQNAEGDTLRYLATGPLCRHAEDLMPLLNLLAGPDGGDAGCIDWPLGDPGTVDLKQVQVFNVTGNGKNRVSGDLQAAQSGVADHLAAVAMSVDYLEIPELEKSFDLWSTMLGAAEPASKFRRDMQRDGVFSLLVQLLLWPVRATPHTLPRTRAPPP